MSAEYVLSHLRQQQRCPGPQRIAHPAAPGQPCPRGCKCGARPAADVPNLAYFAVIPNYGQTGKIPYGGSREPYGYLQFILDFWGNLPPVVIFSQDDCLARGCAWGARLERLDTALRDWPRHFSGIPSASNCFCKFIREDKYLNRGYFWWRFMSFAQERMFNVTLARRSSVVTWPQDATFAVGSAAIASQPLWVYESWTRLMTVEKACIRAGTIMWAHSLERLWFEVFDRPAEKRIVPGRDGAGACFAEGSGSWWTST